MRLLVLICLSLLASAVVAKPSGQDRGAARRLMEEGKRSFAARSYVDAARYFDSAAKLDPALVMALYNQAFALRKLKLFDESRAAYRAYLQTSPDDLDAVFGLAECERALLHDDKASKLYARYVQGETRASKKNHIARARIFVRDHPSETNALPSASGSLADAHRAYAQKEYLRAAQIYDGNFRKNPLDAMTLYRSALSFRKAKDYALAKSAYERFLTLRPRDADATYGLAETERLLGNRAAAATLFSRYVRLERRPSEREYIARARAQAEALSQPLPEAAATVKADAPKVAPKAVPKTETAKTDAPKVTPAAAKVAKTDAAKVAKTGAAKVAKTDAPKVAPAAAKVAAADAPKVDAAKAEPRVSRLASFLRGHEEVTASEPDKKAKKMPPPKIGFVDDKNDSARQRLAAAQRALLEDPEDAAAKEAQARAKRMLGWEGLGKGTDVTADVTAANKAYARADFEDAEVRITKALMRNDSDYEALLLFGKIALAQKDISIAQRALQKALASASGKAAPLWYLAKASNDDVDRRYYLDLYLHSTAADVDKALQAKAARRLEEP